MQIQPYLSFEGRCDEAIEFYKKAIDAKVDMLMRFKEAPDQSMVSPGNADKVMHAALRAGDTQLLMSDGRCTGGANFHGIALALSRPDRRRRLHHRHLRRRGRQDQNDPAHARPARWSIKPSPICKAWKWAGPIASTSLRRCSGARLGGA